VDPEKDAQRLVLFADNEQFDAELNAAVREKWIAAWLYLRYLNAADNDSGHDNEPELVRVANLVNYILRSSDAPQHAQVKKEISDFLRFRRSRRRAGESESTNG
jgi:hypothetical protein